MLEKCQNLSISCEGIWLGVRIDKQEMVLVGEEGTILKKWKVSTSKRPPSCEEDSLGTPWGLHKIEEKIGEGEPIGMVFKGRVPTGKTYDQYEGEEAEGNLITTRILRLRGLEEGVNSGGNQDSWYRYIYIHGTNHEDRIGSPASSGCVQLKNTEMLDVFERVPIGTRLLIVRE
jgi:hypothetical protein